MISNTVGSNNRGAQGARPDRSQSLGSDLGLSAIKVKEWMLTPLSTWWRELRWHKTGTWLPTESQIWGKRKGMVLMSIDTKFIFNVQEEKEAKSLVDTNARHVPSPLSLPLPPAKESSVSENHLEANMSSCPILKIKEALVSLGKLFNLFVVGRRMYRSVFICLSILSWCDI